MITWDKVITKSYFMSLNSYWEKIYESCDVTWDKKKQYKCAVTNSFWRYCAIQNIMCCINYKECIVISFIFAGEYGPYGYPSYMTFGETQRRVSDTDTDSSIDVTPGCKGKGKWMVMTWNGNAFRITGESNSYRRIPTTKGQLCSTSHW